MCQRLLSVTVGAILLCPAFAGATKTLPGDLSELVTAARAIVHGHVIDVRSVETPDRGIETLVTLEAYDYLKGQLGRIVTFRAFGGEIGRYRAVAVGAPVFTVGDEVVLLLGARGPIIPYVLGVSQGVFRVRHTPDGEKIVVPPALLGLSSIEGAARVVRGDRERKPSRLEAFKGQVRTLVTQAVEREQGGGR